MTLIKNFRYRPEIDGLRAVAVLAVVFFHAGIGFPGGYIGVDVFFVISGFLITSLILKDLQEGRFTLANFWERRARRIIPAAVVVVLATLVGGWFLLLPTDYAMLGESALWQAIFGANIYFWRSTNYFAGPADEQPLLHTWSLAVEEQFYLFFPLLLVGLFCFPRFRRRAILLLILGTGLLASLLLSVYGVTAHPTPTFYLLPTRAWELLCGAVVAILPAAMVPRRRLLRALLSWAGLAAIVLPCLLYDRNTLFPGLAAIPPCLGTCLFIVATAASSSDGSRMALPGAMLSCRPVVFVGLISYSLYLWHWPLFAFSHYWALEPLSVTYRVGLVGAAFGLAVVSWRFVEMPFRARHLGVKRSTMFMHALSGLAITAAAAGFLLLRQGVPMRYSSKVVAYDAAKAEPRVLGRYLDEIELKDALAGRFPRIGAPAPAPVRLLVWGDSHTRAILPAVARSLELHGVGALVAWHPSTAPVLDYQSTGRFALKRSSPRFNQSVFDHLQSQEISDVLLAAKWSGYWQNEFHEPSANTSSSGKAPGFPEALLNTVRELRRINCRVWLLLEVPNHRAPVPLALARHELFGTNIERFVADQASHEQLSSAMRQLVPDLVDEGVHILDLAPVLFDPKTQRFLMEKDDLVLYTDRHHLSRSSSRLTAGTFTQILSVPDPLDEHVLPSSR